MLPIYAGCPSEQSKTLALGNSEYHNLNYFQIHFWEIEGYVNISFEFKQAIKKELLCKGPISNIAAKTNISSVSIGLFLNKENTFMRIRNFASVLQIAGLPLETAEKQIIYYRDTSSKFPFKIIFPYTFTPLHFRVIGTLFGDGNVHRKNKMSRWIQKDVSPLRNLVAYLLKAEIKAHTNATQITIPAFFTKMGAKILNLEQTQLGSEDVLEASLLLPRFYRIALLLAVIEDEGNIDVINYGCISIRISSERGIYLIQRLCHSLAYKTSKIKKYMNNSNFKNNYMYRLNILSEGIEQLGSDILEFEQCYSPLGSLWKKRQPFFKRWSICVGRLSQKCKEGRKLHQNILEMFKEGNTLSSNSIAARLNITRARAYDFLRRLYHKSMIERIGKGFYTLNQKIKGRHSTAALEFL